MAKNETPTNLEDALEVILTLRNENDDLRTANETLSQNNANLTAEVDRVRVINQRYFERLSMQDSETDRKTTHEEESDSCLEFAKKLNI